MEDRELPERIALDPQAMTGKAIIRGTRLTVEHVLHLIARGETVAREDVLACVLFAAKTVAATTFAPFAAETA